MKIHEFQAKMLLRKEEVPLPRGKSADTPSMVREIAREINKTVVVKAQVHVGGRGKAGGIKLASTPDEAEKIGGKILSMRLKGLPVNKVLVEEALDIKKEFYLGITLDRAKNQNVIILSPKGGVDIEEVAKTHPDEIFEEYVDPVLGLMEFQKNSLVFCVDLPPASRKSLKNFITTLYNMYVKYDCTLAEINPLALLSDGSFTAADAKIIHDDNALYRHKNLMEYREFAEEDPIEQEAHRQGIAYVRLEGGDVGIIGNGAGLVMCTLDMIARAGGKPANFLDVGGGAKAELVERSMNLVLMDKDVKGLFLNIFGGITRCDEVAKGIIQAVRNLNLKLPIVIRLSGTNEKEGRKLLSEAGFNTVETMLEGASRIVGLVNK
ncbi:MAG: ADP-forming succinate--CoA ligase subunit beta [Candidatus Eremiobacteraeota bacterium]|nr:ADP-forming succinate--CoA ligase subunit beta [Candidatus Eremiobacteraeota bacterium]